MPRYALILTCLLFAVFANAKGWAPEGWTPDKWFREARSPRIANYQIQATLDWPAKTLSGKERIHWRNTGTTPTSDFPLHLYMNAFSGPQSLFMKESQWKEPKRFRDANGWGYCRLKQIHFEGQRLDGHFGEDETVYWVQLPRKVHPGESIKVEVAWETKFPRLIARSGWEGDFLMGAQWFPKVGVYQNDTWNCHAYHAFTEFFADFGTYDVELSMPKGLLPAMTGACVPQAGPANQALDARQDPAIAMNCIYKAHAEDVHDFAWAVMPKLSWNYRKFEYRGIQLYYFYQGRNLAAFNRQQEALKAALRASAEWVFPYPYPVLTVVDAPREARAADAMEYPTLLMASSTHFDPFRFRYTPEDVTIHEFGHQFFQGILASNEVEEPWLDEGLTTWFAQRTLKENGQSLFASRRFHIDSDFNSWSNYWETPSMDPITTPGYLTRNFQSYTVTSYSKPALVLMQLEAMFGRPLMEKVIQTYAKEMAFKHPTRNDFKRVLERVTGRDINDFWKTYFDGTDTLDYIISKVENVDCLKGGWMKDNTKLSFIPVQSVTPGQSRIYLQRKGGICVPLTLWIRLEDKTEHRVNWNGQSRWTSFEFQSPITAAILDPDGNYPILKDRIHTCYTKKPTKRGLHYWSQLLWGGLTTLLQGIGLG